MSKPFSVIGVLMMMLAMGLSTADLSAQRAVEVMPNEAAQRVDISIDGHPFTSYIWPDTLKVPVLYPLRTADGTPITRGYPLAPRPGERVDHPHHAGFWLNYGSVNGVDFWNNSTHVPPAQQAAMGTVVHRKIVSAASGADKGTLEVEMDWIMPDGSTILHEKTLFTFRGDAKTRSIDRVTTLTALDQPVSLKDDKEGMLGLRVRKELEQPTQESVAHTDAAGKPTTQKSVDNTGVSGQYLSSEGKTGDAAWGTRGRWMSLSGKVESEPITLLILDHPQNVGFPTYWHARGYGLFAANPLGQAEFSRGKDMLNYAMQPKQSTTFRYRLLIIDEQTTPEKMESMYQQFIQEVK